MLRAAERTPLANDLLSVTVVYLYTYPTLLVRLAPLLIRLFVKGNLHAVITLTYHLQDVDRVTVKKVDKEYDLRLYTRIEGAQIKEDRKQAS